MVLVFFFPGIFCGVDISETVFSISPKFRAYHDKSKDLRIC